MTTCCNSSPVQQTPNSASPPLVGHHLPTRSVLLLAFFLLLSGACAQTSSAILDVTAQRPILLWLQINDVVTSNTEPHQNDPTVIHMGTATLELELSVKTNYAYWLTVSSATGSVTSFHDSTALMWRTHSPNDWSGLDIQEDEALIVLLEYVDD